MNADISEAMTALSEAPLASQTMPDAVPVSAIVQERYLPNPAWLAPAAKITSIIPILIATSSLLGWLLNIDLLKSIGAGLNTMKVNTAIALASIGAGQLLLMWIEARGRNRAAVIGRVIVFLCGSITLTIGSLTLLEHGFGFNFGIDNWLILDAEPMSGVTAGRMSVATASALLTIGAGLMTGQMIFSWMALATAGFTLICYMLDLYALSRSGFANMALHTSISIVMLVCSRMMSRPDRGMMRLLLANSLGGALARGMLPVAILAPIAVSWLAGFTQYNGILDSNVAAALAATLGIILLMLVVFTTGRALAAIDQRRRQAELQLRLSHDALEAKVLERTEELRQARDEANGANRHKSIFLAHMSHELRTPLNAILGFADIMRRQQFGAIGQPRYVDYADDIHNSGSHLLALINDILDLSKIEAGKYDFEPRPVDTATLIRACHDLMAGLAKDHQLRFSVAAPQHLPAIMGDERAVKQILINLLSNAIKFTPSGGDVILSAEPSIDAGYLVFTITDTGIGMTVADMARAQTPFGQIQNQFSRTHKGTGLGLFLAKQLTELQAGRLDIASEPGQGTTIRVSLPIVA